MASPMMFEEVHTYSSEKPLKPKRHLPNKKNWECRGKEAEKPRSQEAEKPSSQEAKQPKSQAAKKPRSQEAKKPRSQEAEKPRSQEAKKTRIQKSQKRKNKTSKKEPKIIPLLYEIRTKGPSSPITGCYGSYGHAFYLGTLWWTSFVHQPLSRGFLI